MDKPEPGHWLVRLVKGGPSVPACIRWCETTVEPGEPSNLMHGTRYRFLAAFINGDPVPLDRVWLTRGTPIDRAEHDFRVADTNWAMTNAPAEPAARPTERVDLRQTSIPF